MHRMFGLEAEMAFTLLSRDNSVVSPSLVLPQLMRIARHELPHLPMDDGDGIFLQNGSRFYLDCGKPEITTPEVTSPDDLCRYARAGERILAALMQKLVHVEMGLSRVVLTRCNVSYSGNAATWGCHESYAHRHRVDGPVFGARMARQILPFLVSRIVFTGSGGFRNDSNGLEFMLSPRVVHLTKATSSDSTDSRGIFDTRDEPLNQAGYHRLHLLCAENVCSELSLWLRFATTALVVALIEHGGKPGADVRLASPLMAMRDFAGDPTLTCRVPRIDGKLMSAIEIQWHYLRAVEHSLDRPCMPVWAEKACQRWRGILERLQQGPAAVERTLDWAIKWRLFRDHAAACNVDWNSLPAWTSVFYQLRRLQRQRQRQRRQPPGRHDRDGEQWRNLEPVLLLQENAGHGAPAIWPILLREYGLHGDDYPAVWALRAQLFELDTRFGQIDDRGVFHALDRAGVLDHHVPGVDDIERAMTEPPAVGRARLRGECVRRYAGRPGWSCSWDHVSNAQERKCLDLSDPFVETEQWSSPSEEPPSSA